MADDDHPLAILIRNLDAHSPLSDADRAQLRALPHMLRRLSPNAYLVRDGEAAGGCAILIAGFAFRQKHTADGSRQILSIHLPGEALDLQHLHLDRADHNVQALTEVDVALVPRQSIRDLARDNVAIGKALAVAGLVEAAILREWLVNLGRREGRARLAHLLCEFAVRLERLGIVDDYGYILPMSQEWLADALGLTAVHVNRLVRSLTAEGLIVRERRAIAFADWPALRAVAGFDDRYLHLGRQWTA